MSMARKFFSNASINTRNPKSSGLFGFNANKKKVTNQETIGASVQKVPTRQTSKETKCSKEYDDSKFKRSA